MIDTRIHGELLNSLRRWRSTSYHASFSLEPTSCTRLEKPIELIKLGIRNNPDQWHLYYDLGLVYYLDLKDYRSAAKAFEEGSKLPKAHPFMKLLAGNIAQPAGEYDMARMLWTATHESTSDKLVRANALAHLRAIRVDQDVMALNDIVGRYGHETGHVPHSFSNLISVGLLRNVPVDPLGWSYNLMPDGSIEVYVIAHHLFRKVFLSVIFHRK